MKKWWLGTGTLAAVAALIVAGVFWVNRTGTFSYANYERIRPGMKLAEAERLLGGPGSEVAQKWLPRIVDHDVPLAHPKRVKPVVWGDRYIRWEDGPSYIIVSLHGEVVAEKWYWEPSL